MILKKFYEQKKERILAIINAGKPQNSLIDFSLYNDAVFKGGKYKFPMVLFKYNNIVWNTSSEKEYKADVDFSVYVVLEAVTKKGGDYLDSLELARQIDQAILLYPTSTEIEQNDTLIPNSAIKVREGQYTIENDNWEKSNFYIWEINYSTTLIEKEYKKKYVMLSNGAFNKKNLDGGVKEERIRQNLLALGYDLDDYKEVVHNGKKLLQFKNIKESIRYNDSKQEVFKGKQKQ